MGDTKMNIFYLDHDTNHCAQYHCDRHCVKMIVEYAQILSTTHRVLDGSEYLELSKNNRKIKRWKLHDSREHLLCKATHVNHPSCVWARDNIENYNWLSKLLSDLSDEYTYRYGKIHKYKQNGLIELLQNPPHNILKSAKFYPPTPAMPDECILKEGFYFCFIQSSYHKYYNIHKKHIHKWTKRIVPHFIGGVY